MSKDVFRRAMSIDDAAATLAIGRTHLYKLINLGQIEVTKVGRRTLVHVDSVERVLAGPVHQRIARHCVTSKVNFLPREAQFIRQMMFARSVTERQDKWLKNLGERAGYSAS